MPELSRRRHPAATKRRAATQRGRRSLVVLLLAALLLPLGLSASSMAATEITVENRGGLTQAGPVNPAHGFPAWYEDSAGLRLEPCIDHLDPLCEIPPDHIPNPIAPLSFPDNFPVEIFYQLVSAEIALRGGGTAELVLGLEGAWLNEVVDPGQQTVFARIRVDVDDAVPGTTYRFRHPFGELTVDTDERGRGRMVEDAFPALNNFDTALDGNFGPFLRWRPGVLPEPPAGYVGDPRVLHQVTGSPIKFNRFTAWQHDLQEGTTDLFSISGKIATNTGLTADRAAVNGNFLDVFATSKGTQLEVAGQNGVFGTTAMVNDPGSDRFYARIALQPGAAAPTEVTVRNIGDDPVSTKTYKISGVTVNQASYDGTNITVAATAIAPATYPLEVVGYKNANGGALKLTSAAPVTVPSLAPPATVTVKDASGVTATLPVTVLDGPATPTGPPPEETEPEPAQATPGAPTDVEVTAGDAQVTVRWIAPANTGTSPLIRYLVTAVDRNGVVSKTTTAPDAIEATVSGLTNGERYTVRVRAVNSSGSGESSAPVHVTPAAP
jgi:hypothetical protein